MFGYIKPDKELLLVKDLHLYKATYCGLCSVIKKNISFFLPFALSYDFVFLNMVRAALSSEKSIIKKGRCKYNTFKKCAFSVCDTESIYTAKAALILTALKLEDDLKDCDVSLFKKMITFPFYKHLEQRVKKAEKENSKYSQLVNDIRHNLEKISQLEEKNSKDIDLLCELFGEIMSKITQFSISEEKKIIANEIGSCIGRYVYLIDAIDDIDKDYKKGAYNPVLAKYDSPKEARKHFKELDVALSMYTQRALLALNLLDECEYTAIINNTITLGLGKESYKIMTKNGDKE